MKKRKYLVLTADIVGSRQSGLKQKDIKNILDKVNCEKYKNKRTDFYLSRGDELQAVFAFDKDNFHIFDVILDLKYNFMPHKLRFGVGFGEIEGKLEKDPWNMTGEAFFCAREALEYVRDNKRCIKIVIKDIENINLEALDLAVDFWQDLVFDRLTDKQFEALYEYKKLKKYEKVAEKLNISVEAVYYRLKDIKIESIERCEFVAEKSIINNKKFK